MMGRQSKVQNKLFYTAINLEQRVRKNHILRKVKRQIDFDFIYNEVKDTYGIKGNESVAPPVILKMMLLLTFYNVRSERELMATIAERLDWLWFLDYDVVNQESLKHYLNKSYQILESRLEQQAQSSSSDGALKSGAANQKYISTTDPDASVTRRGKGKSKLKYQIHRGVDPRHEVITATEVTPGEVHEAHRMQALIDTHEKNTETTVETAVADSKYGSIENYLACHDRGIKAHFTSLEEAQHGTGTKKGIFAKQAFAYNAESDTFICPAGQTLKRRNFNKKRQHYEYITAAGTCNRCRLKAQCTKAKSGRTLKRHIRQDDLDAMLQQARSPESKKDIRTRQHLMERTFAQATRYGYQRARWRGLWRVQIQEYLTAALQNIKILVKNVKEPAPALQMQVAPEVADIASRTKCYGLNNLFILQGCGIARFCLLVGKNLAYRPAEIVA
jgi:hypothetical protein